MKTTVELNDELFIKAKKHAAEKRTTLRHLIEQGLRQQLAAHPVRRQTRRIQWKTVPGGLPETLNISSRLHMHEWIARQK